MTTTTSRMIFVNLPVRDLDASRRFFSALGYSFNEQFCDDDALCLVIGDTIFAMLLRRDFFAGFTPRAVADAHETSQTLLALSADRREDVDALAGRAIAAGGEDLRTMEEKNSSGVTFMYARSFADLDGHIWEILWMDPSLTG